MKVHNLCWHGTAEGCHFWLVFLSLETTVRILCTPDQKVTEKLCLAKNKYTPLHDAAYNGKDYVGVKFSFPATF